MVYKPEYPPRSEISVNEWYAKTNRTARNKWYQEKETIEAQWLQKFERRSKLIKRRLDEVWPDCKNKAVLHTVKAVHKVDLSKISIFIVELEASTG